MVWLANLDAFLEAPLGNEELGKFPLEQSMPIAILGRLVGCRLKMLLSCLDCAFHGKTIASSCGYVNGNLILISIRMYNSIDAAMAYENRKTHLVLVKSDSYNLA